MKKICFLLTLSSLFLSCSKDADETDSEMQDFTVILNIDPYHRFSRFQLSTYAFLSDENGTILDSGELRIGETTTLNFSGNPEMHYDLSYMRYDDIVDLGIEAYSLVTYTDIAQGTYTIGSASLIENSFDEIFINLTNTGHPFEVTSATAGTGIGGPENGGYFNFRSNLVGSPTSDFYASFKSPNDQFERYFWQRDIPENDVFNIDYNTLPEITNVVNTQIPSNDYSNFSVEGFKNDDENNIHHNIEIGNFAGGNSSLLTSTPSNVFDNFVFKVYYSNDNVGYSKQLRTTSIPAQIDAPALDFTVNNPSPQNFNMSTTGEATIYSVLFRAENTDGTVLVSHNILGEVTPEITFSKENLRRNIQQTYPELTGFETLPLGSASLIYYSLTNSYLDILNYKIQGDYYEIPETNGFVDSRLKQFD